jgi:hypothetical protein
MSRQRDVQGEARRIHADGAFLDWSTVVNQRHTWWMGLSMLFLSACGGSEFESHTEPIDDGGGDTAISTGGNPSGGHAGKTGSGGSSSGGTAGGVAGAGGAAGASGASGSAGVAGSAGGVAEDAGTDAACDELLYLDGDGDDYGGTTTTVGCEGAPGWALSGGDCDDSNPDVHPGQTSYFVTGYVKTGSIEVSFDYDCSGNETEAGSNAKVACQMVNLQCQGAGYKVATPFRSGPGVDPFCGSDTKVPCVKNMLQCDPGTPYSAAAIACR